MIEIADLNRLGQDRFAEALEGIVEDSAWVVRQAWHRRPFTTPQALHAAIVEELDRAGPERQIDVLRAHPELGAGGLSATSAGEQRRVGLHALDDRQARALRQLNREYRERFGFPLIVFVREHTADSMIDWGRERLACSRQAELTTALREVSKIVRARLEDRLAAPIRG